MHLVQMKASRLDESFLNKTHTQYVWDQFATALFPAVPLSTKTDAGK